MSTAASPLTVNQELEAAIAAATSPETVMAAVRVEAEKQGLAATAAADAQKAADAAAVAKKIEEEKNTAAVVYQRTEVIGGKTFNFEAESELELERQITNAFRVAYAIQTPEDTEQLALTNQTAAQHAEEQVAAAAAAAKERVALLAELEVKFKRGEISTAEYLEKSGAMADYLEKQGIPLEALRASVEDTQTSREQQSWAEATQAFLAGVGADWPGGERNREILGMKLLSLGLEDAKDKVAALARAFQSMKETNMVFPYEAPATGAAVVAAAATLTPEQQAAEAQAARDKKLVDNAIAAERARVAALTPARLPANSSSIFGASSGVGAGEDAARAAAAATAAGQIPIPKDATPQQILDAWKDAQQKLGKDPNAEFVETFRARK